MRSLYQGFVKWVQRSPKALTALRQLINLSGFVIFYGGITALIAGFNNPQDIPLSVGICGAGTISALLLSKVLFDAEDSGDE